jgi:sporulation protein YlmC with PRC-barrel domain
MAKNLFYGMVIAATALTTLPVLAQVAPGAAPTPAPASNMAANSNTAVTSPAPTSAASSKPSVTYFTADHQLRASKLVGASVYNGQDQSIGSIDDVLMGDADHKADMAIISVGGFLGIGSKLVSVPFEQIKIQDNKVVMPGATKASLESMPGYNYKA